MGALLVHLTPDIFFCPKAMNIVHYEVIRNFSEIRVPSEGTTLEAKQPERKNLFEGFTTQPAPW